MYCILDAVDGGPGRTEMLGAVDVTIANLIFVFYVYVCFAFLDKIEEKDPFYDMRMEFQWFFAYCCAVVYFNLDTIIFQRAPY